MPKVMLTGMVWHPRSVQRTLALIAHFWVYYHIAWASFSLVHSYGLRGPRIQDELKWTPTFLYGYT